MVKHEKSKEQLECLRENYKIVLQKLCEKRDLETVLYLRMMMETGIRCRDLCELNDSNIKGREIKISALKDGM